MKIIKVNSNQNILNEDGLSAGFNSVGYNNSGFAYEILPLMRNLEQKGNEPVITKGFKHFVGDIVKGLCPYDNKKHKGMIKYLYFDEHDLDDPKLVYIQDEKNNDTIPLKPDTVKKCKITPTVTNPNKNYFTSHAGEVDYEFNSVSPVKESIKKYDFNTLNEDTLNTISFDDELPSEEDVHMHKISNKSAHEDLMREQFKLYWMEQYLNLLENKNQFQFIKTPFDNRFFEFLPYLKEYGYEFNDHYQLVAFVHMYAATWSYKTPYSLTLKGDDDPVDLNIIKLGPNLTDLSYVCYGIRRKFILDKWDTSNITDFSYAFAYTNIYDNDDRYANIDLSSAINVNNMFEACNGGITEGRQGVLNVSNFDVSNLISLDAMFRDCKLQKLVGLNKWDVSNITNLSFLFYNADIMDLSFLYDMRYWNLQSCVYFNSIFLNFKSASDLSSYKLPALVKEVFDIERNHILPIAYGKNTCGNWPNGYDMDFIKLIKKIKKDELNAKKEDILNDADSPLNLLKNDKLIAKYYTIEMNKLGNITLVDGNLTKCTIIKVVEYNTYYNLHKDYWHYNLYSALRIGHRKGKYYLKNQYHTYNNTALPFKREDAESFEELMDKLKNQIYFNWRWNPDYEE